MKIINSRWLPAFLILIMLVFFTGCTSIKHKHKHTSIVGGALSYHNTSAKKDGENPLIGLEVGNTQCGAYDNSRLKPSTSYYCSYRWLNLQIPNTPIALTSKAGLAYYDNKSGYPSDLKIIGSLGARAYLSKRLWLDLDYLPQSLINDKKSDITTLTFGYRLDGEL